MWGTCKIVHFSWLLFAALLIGQNLLTPKNTLLKWSLNTYCINGLSVGLCILCVKMRTFRLCGESTLPHNNRNCFPPYPDHYLTNLTVYQLIQILNLSVNKVNLRYVARQFQGIKAHWQTGFAESFQIEISVVINSRSSSAKLFMYFIQ